MIDGAQLYSPKVTKKTTIRFFNPRHKQCRGRKLITYQFVTGAVDEVVPVDGRVPLEAALAEHHVHEGQRTLKSEIVAIFNAATDHLPPKQSVEGSNPTVFFPAFLHRSCPLSGTSKRFIFTWEVEARIMDTHMFYPLQNRCNNHIGSEMGN